ncbi:MAG: hypothetical protein V3R86_06815, partial [Candidatus Hydrothermarchaeaceae archaeon]
MSLAIIFQLIFFYSAANSYEIKPDFSPCLGNDIEITSVEGFHEVIDKNDLRVNIIADITVKKDIL